MRQGDGLNASDDGRPQSPQAINQGFVLSLSRENCSVSRAQLLVLEVCFPPLEHWGD